MSDELTTNIVVSILKGVQMSGIVVSILTGIVTGIIVARLARFENLRSEAQRILRSLEYISHNRTNVEILNKPDTRLLLHIIADMYALGHKDAGTALAKINSSIVNNPMLQPTFDQISALDSQWQKEVRELKPNIIPLLRLNLKS